LPKEVFDGFQAQTANNRAQFFRDVPTGPFYGYNLPNDARVVNFVNADVIATRLSPLKPELAGVTAALVLRPQRQARPIASFP
jgi:hypothetical protein